MRHILDHFVVSTIGIDDTLGDFGPTAILRRSQDGQLDASLLDWLDLRPEYELLNRHRNLLPEGLAKEVRELTHEVDIIEPIRHTIMHGRPMRPNDAEHLSFSLKKFQQPHWQQVQSALRSISQNPLWTPDDSLPIPAEELIRHNLPLPDYDETGVLGRDKEIEKLVHELKRRRDSVITLTGEGGIGKSALALEVAYRLLDDPSCPFEMILWVSLKTERLTAHGIEEIADRVDTLLGATRRLGESVSGQGFEGGIDDLSRAIGDTATLICLDNLETISGDEFVLLYESLPTSVSYLVTSRQGIGQIERRYSVGPLAEQDSLLLLNQLIRYRGVGPLERISGETRREIVRRFRNSPLALRWYVLSVEAGNDPLALVHDQTELVDFCVLSVYETLSDGARLVLTSMHILGRPVTTDDLVVLAQIPTHQVQAALQELVRGSLVSYSTISKSMSTSVEVSETAISFLNRYVAADDPIRGMISENERQFRQFNEKNRSDNQARSLAPIVIRVRSDEDRPSASILRNALLASQKADIETAISHIAQAKSLNPEYWEVFRVEAFILSRSNPALAGARYQRAYELAETAEHKAIAAHFYAGHLARNEHDIDAAVGLAREAHSTLGWPDTARSLGNMLVWAGEFDDGIALLEIALIDAAPGRERNITLTALLEALRRKSEIILSQESYPIRAWEHSWRAWTLSISELNQGISDARFVKVTVEVALQSLIVLKVADKFAVDLPNTDALFVTIADQAKRILLEPRIATRIVSILRDLQENRTTNQALATAIATLADELDYENGEVRYNSAVASEFRDGAQGETWLRGTIIMISRNQGFGFLSHPDHPQNVFFHVSALPNSQEFASLQEGQEVEWVHEQDSANRDRAKLVRQPKHLQSHEVPKSRAVALEIALAEVSNRQRVFVTGKPPLTFLFARATDGRSVFIHRDIFPTVEAFLDIPIGAELDCDLELDDQSRWKVTSIHE